MARADSESGRPRARGMPLGSLTPLELIKEAVGIEGTVFNLGHV